MSREGLAEYRIERAEEILTEAEDVYAQEHYKLCVNRCYYAMFTAARALLALKDKDSSKHSGIISLFNRYIIKDGLFPKEQSKYLPKAKDLREGADYGDFVEITREDAEIQIKRAKEFIEDAKQTKKRMLD